MARSTTRKTTKKDETEAQAKEKAAEEIAGQEDSAPKTPEDAPELAELDAGDPAPGTATLTTASVRGDAIEPSHDTTTVRKNKRAADAEEGDNPIGVDVNPPDAAGELSDKRVRDADPAGIKTGKFSEPKALDPNRVTPHLEGQSAEVMHPNPDAPPSEGYGEVQSHAGTTHFESREAEPYMFDVMGITPQRRFSDRRLEWHVPNARADDFGRHHHVQIGRIVRKG